MLSIGLTGLLVSSKSIDCGRAQSPASVSADLRLEPVQKLGHFGTGYKAWSETLVSDSHQLKSSTRSHR